MSMIIDGTNGLTFNNATTQNSGGKVIQVIQYVSSPTYTFSTSSTTPVATAVSVSITPLFSTSKILVLSNFQNYTPQAGANNIWYIYRNGTTSLVSTTSSYAASSTSAGTIALQYLDSPATTSSTSYAIWVATQSGANSAVLNGVGNYAPSVITVMEIAG